MTTTPSRTTKARTRRRPAGPADGRHATAVRVRPKHAAPDGEPAGPHRSIPYPEIPPQPRTYPAVPRTHRAPGRGIFLNAALLRCALYLGPLSVAVAAGTQLAQVAWPVPLGALLLGWTAAQALTSAGVAVAGRAGTAAACRLVGGGFAATAGLWCALVWVVPATLLGPHRGLTLVIGLGGLASLATVTAALVTRGEAAIVRWSLPSWLLALATLAELLDDRLGAGDLPPLPVATLLPAAIVVVLVRAFRPALLPGPRRRARLTGTDLRRAGGYLIVGASQASCVGLLWQAGPGSTVPLWLPLLVAVPIMEALIGWHTDRVSTAGGAAGHHRDARGITVLTLTGLVPPLAVGVALLVAAYRTPPYLAALAGARPGVLALAAGTLLGGVFAITFLLAARGRTAAAATVAAAPPLVTAVLKLLPLPTAGPLPDAVGVLALTHLAGLIVVALTAADPRRTP